MSYKKISYSESKKGGAKKSNRGKLPFLIKFNIFMLVFLMICAGGIGTAYAFLYEPVKDPGHILTVNRTNPPDKTAEPLGSDDPNHGTQLSFNKDVVSVLLIGADMAAWRDVTQFGYNSDVMMLFVLNVKTCTGTVISLPRDTWALIDRVNTNTGKPTTQYTGKLNSAFSQGGGPDKYSYDNTVRAVSRMLNIPIDYYVGLNMDGVGPLTDAVGGVDVVIQADFSAFGWPKGSTQHLTGANALTYVRERENIGTDGSDISRTGRQREFVQAYINKVKTLGAVDLVTKLYGPMSQYVDYDPKINLQVAVSFATVLSKMDMNSINFQILPGDLYNGGWEPDKTAVTQLMNSLFYVQKNR